MQSKQVVCKVCNQTVQAVQTTMAQGGDKRFTMRQSARYFTIRPHKQQNNGGRACDGSGRRA